jgi:2'-5' RNA ligase
VEEKRIYLLAQFDEAAQQRLAGIYDELVRAGFLGKQTPGVPYHFTLGSFEVGSEREVLERAREVCRRTSAFDISFSHIGLFGLKVLFAAPAMNGELLGLHDALAPDEPAIGVHNWVAHATLLIDEPDVLEAAIPIVSGCFSPFSTRVESIGVYEFFPARFIANFRLNP